MRFNLLIGGCALALFLPAASIAESFLVKDSQPRAQIIVPQTLPSSVKLAANELQRYLEKISGAEVPIVSDPGAEVPVKIYVGKSQHTERLGVTDEGLEFGAFRMKSGEDWLVLLGRDRDFAPRGIWRKSRTHWQNEGIKEWDEATGSHWMNPLGAGYPKYNKELDLWRFDETGTLNAVYEFLRRQGIRWYMPGELGEIVPEKSDIELPAVDETVTPDYKIRLVNFARYPVAPLDDILWSLRLGVNDPFGYHTHHGLKWITRREEMRKAHPEYLALYGDKRDSSNNANACLSNEGLFQEHLRFLRFMFDMYDPPILSVWPDDGFTRICECEDCRGKNTPERGNEGSLSDYVWDYVNRVAAELEKTHPDKLISCGAYSTYRLPPKNIDDLHPNVVVYVVNGRRRWAVSDEELQQLREMKRLWAGKSSHELINFINFWWGNTPRLIAEDIKAQKDIVMGEDLWVSERRGLATPGWHHLNTYITTRFWWDADQDIDVVLDEYYEKFYGPAAAEMKAFIEFWEPNYRNMGSVTSADLIRQALDLFENVRAKVDPDTVYGKRVALFGEGLEPFRKRYAQIAKGREDIPSTRAYGVAEQIAALKIDGKLDDRFWHNAAGAAHLPGKLVEYKTGAKPTYPSRFKFGTDKKYLYFAIRCSDEPGKPLNITTSENEDHAIWHGDNVEILIETASHSYYQIAINPAGAIADLDRNGGKNFRWDSKAEFAVHVDKEAGYWSVEGRIPFTDSTNDPLHEIIGSTPRPDLPWFVNVCRQRVRGDEMERTCWSPSEEGFHNVLKFGQLSKPR